jgi:hypothetical protein
MPQTYWAILEASSNRSYFTLVCTEASVLKSGEKKKNPYLKKQDITAPVGNTPNTDFVSSAYLSLQYIIIFATSPALRTVPD